LDPDPGPDAEPVYLSISGGGWNTHSAQAGWFSGMLDASGADLAALTQHVDAVSANSGGAWFLTQLAYSEAFRDALENDRDAYTTTGFLGQTRDFWEFDEPCTDLALYTYEVMCDYLDSTKPIFRMMKMADTDELDWSKMVSDVVYRPFEMSKELTGHTLSDARQAWAEDKALVLAAAMMTDQVILSNDKWSTKYFDINVSDKDMYDQVNFTPAFLSDMGGSGHSAPSIFPADTMVVSYYDEGWTSTTGPVDVELTQHSTGQVPVMSAATASSAAVAGLASMRVLDEADLYSTMLISESTLSYTSSLLAPPAHFSGSQIQFPETIGGEKFSTYSDQQTVRFADGGYVDNSAVAFMLAHLENNALADDFNLVLFSNSGANDAQLGELAMSSTVSNLFGTDATVAGRQTVCLEDYCLETMSPHVFDESAWDDVEATWSHTENEVTLEYFELSVQTVENTTFGVSGGYSGTLHLFTLRHDETEPMPTVVETFDVYDAVFEVARAGVAEHGGWEHLARALQIEQGK